MFDIRAKQHDWHRVAQSFRPSLFKPSAIIGKQDGQLHSGHIIYAPSMPPFTSHSTAKINHQMFRGIIVIYRYLSEPIIFAKYTV